MAFEFVGQTIKAQVSSGASAIKRAAAGTVGEYLSPKVMGTMGDVFSKASAGLGKQIEKFRSTSTPDIGGQIAKSQAESTSSLGGQIEKSQNDSTYQIVQAVGGVKEAVDNLREMVVVSGEQSEFQLKKLRGDLDGGDGFFGRIFGKQSRIGKFFGGIGRVLGVAGRGFGAAIGVAGKGFGSAVKIAGKGLAPLLRIAGKGLGAVIGGAGKGFGVLIGKVGAGLAPVLGKLGPMLAKVAPALGAAGGIAAAGVGGFMVGKWLNTQIDKAFGEKGGLGKWVFDFLHDPETGIFARAGKLFGAAWEGAKMMAGDVGSTVWGWITGGLKVIGDALSWKSIVSVSSRVGNWISDGLKVIGEKLSWENIVNISGKVNDWINEGVAKIKEKLSWENIVNVSTKIRDWISEGITKIKEKLSWENIVNVSTKIGDWINEGVAKIKEKLSWENIVNISGKVNDWINEGITKIKEKLSWENIVDVSGKVKEWITIGLAKFSEKLSWENIVSISTKIGEWISEGLAKIKEKFSLEGAFQGLTDFIKWLGKAFSFDNILGALKKGAGAILPDWLVNRLFGGKKQAVQVENLVKEQEVRGSSTQKQTNALSQQRREKEVIAVPPMSVVAKPGPVRTETAKITQPATLVKDKSVDSKMNIVTDNKETVGLLGSIKDLLTKVVGTKEPETMREFHDDPLAAFLGSGKL